jgi:hypothetical protein
MSENFQGCYRRQVGTAFFGARREAPVAAAKCYSATLPEELGVLGTGPLGPDMGHPLPLAQAQIRHLQRLLRPKDGNGKLLLSGFRYRNLCFIL